MKTNFNIGKKRYFRIFSIFESELKNYNKIFEKEDYTLTYVIRKTILSKDYDVEVTLSIMKIPLYTRHFDETRNLKKLFQSYCNYFSINAISGKNA